MVVEAEIISFIRTILIFIAVYYAFKFLLKFFFPIFLKSFIARQQKKYNQNAGSSKRKEGEVNINSSKKSTSEFDDLGEYVEYEEIDDQSK